MSELKAYGINGLTGYVVESESGQLYLKSEADKVIADLIEKNERLSDESLIKASNTFREIEKEIRHHKYKRCVAMADKCVDLCNKAKDLCRWAEEENLAHHYSRKVEFYARWHNRWLGLAEKFKSNNSTAQ